MRLRWTLILTTTLGLLLGPLIKDIPGFVVVAIGTHTMQIRLWQMAVILLIFLLSFILFYHLIARVWNSAGRLRSWSGGRRWKKARQKTIRGMIALAEGDWQRAEKLHSQAVRDSDTRLINYLAAAQAAQAQRQDTRRDGYLREAHLAEPGAEIAIGLTQAQLQLNHGQYEQALATLTHLKNLAPKHGHVLLLLQKLYRKLGDWNAFLDLVPDLKKSSPLSERDLEIFQLSALKNLLIKEAARGGIEALHSLWLTIPKKLRGDVSLICQYAELLMQHGAHLEVEKLLRTQIKKQGDEQLLLLYGKAEFEEPAKQLAFVEGLSKQFSDNAIWLLTIGRICRKMEIWGKAQSALQQSIDLKAAPETYRELAQVYDAMGEKDAAISCYRKGLEDALEKPVKTTDLIEIPFAQ